MSTISPATRVSAIRTITDADTFDAAWTQIVAQPDIATLAKLPKVAFYLWCARVFDMTRPGAGR